MKKLIGFDKLRQVCDDKAFDQKGKDKYFVRCKRGIPFCNERVCPIWKDLEEAQPMSLREINLSIKKRK